jgi:hypothetical protein
MMRRAWRDPERAAAALWGQARKSSLVEAEIATYSTLSTSLSSLSSSLASPCSLRASMFLQNPLK